MGSRKRIALKRGSRALKRSEKTGRQEKANPTPERSKWKIAVLPAEVLTASASTEVSCTHEIPDFDVDDDGALTISQLSSAGNVGTSNP